ncbi:MAG: CBS domain-containing protein [Saprospiraceae bacterium]
MVVLKPEVNNNYKKLKKFLKIKVMNKEIPVSEIMTHDPVFVLPDTPIDQIHQLFENNGFHHLLVVKGGKVKGIISKSDYLKVQHMLCYTWSGAIGVKDLFNTMRASDIMSKDPVQIESSDTVGLAADIFLVNSFHALPVVDDGELVGIVTSHDLLFYAYEGRPILIRK